MSRIKVEKLQPAELTAYISWLQTPSKQHTVGIGNGPDRPASESLYVIPFNVHMPASTYAKASCSTTAYAALEPNVTPHVINTLPTGSFSIGVRNYSPARLVRVTGRSAKGKPTDSHITGRSYGKYGGNSLSIPFGLGSSSVVQSEVEVFDQIKAKFEVNGAMPTGELVTLTKEKFSEKS